jgi:regulator of replication initiation timing
MVDAPNRGKEAAPMNSRDILERLDEDDPGDMEIKAEIERLRMAIRNQAGVELSEENDRLIAENEQLRAKIHGYRYAIVSHGNEAQAEIARLRAMIERLQASNG